MVAGDSSVSPKAVTQQDTGTGDAFGLEPTRASTRPFFDDVFARNVTAIVGQSAVLNCRVKHVGDRTVSALHFFLPKKGIFAAPF